MKTTELFAEQVLIGLLVVLMAGLVFFDELYTLYNERVGPGDYLEQLGAGGFVLGAAYFIGMVYDRMVDTLLQDLESHCRLQFALQQPARSGEEIRKDPFEDGRYRILVLGNDQATAHMEYLRSRIRLTRALATALPGLTLALLLALDNQRPGSWWAAVAVTLPVVYIGVLCLKLFARKKFFERPPKTYELERVRDYLHDGFLRGKKKMRWKRTLFLRDEVWAGLAALTIAGVGLIVNSRSYARFSILLVGLVLTLIVGWTWWRISITFYAFLRNYKEYGEPARRA